MSDDQKSADEALADERAAALEEQGPGKGGMAAEPSGTAARRAMVAGDIKIDGAILDVLITISDGD